MHKEWGRERFEGWQSKDQKEWKSKEGRLEEEIVKSQE